MVHKPLTTRQTKGRVAAAAAKTEFAAMIGTDWRIHKFDKHDDDPATYDATIRPLHDYPDIHETVAMHYNKLIDLYEELYSAGHGKNSPLFEQKVNVVLRDFYGTLEKVAPTVEAAQHFDPYELWASTYVDSCRRYEKKTGRDPMLTKAQVQL